MVLFQLTTNIGAMMHTVCLTWASSEYYCNPAKIIVILQEICNLFIDMVSFRWHCGKWLCNQLLMYSFKWHACFLVRFVFTFTSFIIMWAVSTLGFAPLCFRRETSWVQRKWWRDLWERLMRFWQTSEWPLELLWPLETLLTSVKWKWTSSSR